MCDFFLFQAFIVNNVQKFVREVLKRAFKKCGSRPPLCYCYTSKYCPIPSNETFSGSTNLWRYSWDFGHFNISCWWIMGFIRCLQVQICRLNWPVLPLLDPFQQGWNESIIRKMANLAQISNSIPLKKPIIHQNAILESPMN